MPILDVQGLVKTFTQLRPYHRVKAVQGVDFVVEEGEIVGLLGPNGAGKTTSFRMVCGFIEPDRGKVLLGGVDVTDWPMYRRAREGGMGYLPQEHSFFRKLSVEDNLLAVMELLGIDRPTRKRRCDELLRQFNIERLRKSRGLSLSGGEKRRLEIARCLVSDPRIILLDEPFANVDPITIHGIQDIIRDLSDEGISILITDHRELETLEIIDRAYIIESGKVLCHGPPEVVRNNPDAQRCYFGRANRSGRGDLMTLDAV
ncbi:MAG: LPS export ABC transporter ATP-binding protein, partial [Planctomycetes bacterium]|nr:LPS export ABC transporter ATP-binding protein [Planctomycetota bacterium]